MEKIKNIRCWFGEYKQGVNRCELSGNDKSIDVFNVGWLDIEGKIKIWQELLPHSETPARPDINIQFENLINCEILQHGLYPEFKIIRCLDEKKEKDKDQEVKIETEPFTKAKIHADMKNIDFIYNLDSSKMKRIKIWLRQHKNALL